MKNEFTFNCGHPRSEENTYLTHFVGTPKRPAREVPMCKICAKARSKKAYEVRMERIPRDVKTPFCPTCAAGECVGHRGTRPHSRCYEPVTKHENATVCACGAAWALTWKREVEARKKRTPKNALVEMEDAA